MAACARTVERYLWLGALLNKRLDNINGEAFNFGPDHEVVKSVEELVEALIAHQDKGRWEYKPPEDDKKEAMLLKLSCDKALNRLDWRPVLSFEDTVAMTAEWYQKHYKGGADMYEIGHQQIRQYVGKAMKKEMPWTKGKDHDRRRRSRTAQEV